MYIPAKRKPSLPICLPRAIMPSAAISAADRDCVGATCGVSSHSSFYFLPISSTYLFFFSSKSDLATKPYHHKNILIGQLQLQRVPTSQAIALHQLAALTVVVAESLLSPLVVGEYA
jgi:hypothetical protein